MTDKLHQLGNSIGVDTVLLKVTEDTRNAVQRTLLVVKLDSGRVTLQATILTFSVVLGKHIDLGDRFPRHLRYVLNVFQRPVIIEQIDRIKEANACQFVQYATLLGVGLLTQRTSPHGKVRLHMGKPHQPVRTAIHLLHGLVRVPGSDIGIASILLRVSNQVITEPSLLRRKPILIR